MKCADCKHWTADIYDWEAEASGFGRCERIEHSDNIRERVWAPHRGLRTAPTADEIQAEYVKARAYVIDASGYRADLYTLPDFGCVLFEPKTTGEKS